MCRQIVLVILSLVCVVRATPIITEIRVDQDGPDTDEYFELYGQPGETLDRCAYIVLGDASGSGLGGGVEVFVDLGGTSIPDDAYFLAAEASFSLDPTAIDWPTSLNFENGDNVTHLLVTDFIGTVGSDLDRDDDGALDLPLPWSGVLDAVGLLGGKAGNKELVYGAQLGFTDVAPVDFAGLAHVYRDPVSGRGWQIGELAAGLAPNGTDTPGTGPTSVPEPRSLALLLLSFAPATAFGRRRRGKPAACLPKEG